jgi:hypothetical protein
MGVVVGIQTGRPGLDVGVEMMHDYVKDHQVKLLVQGSTLFATQNHPTDIA